MSRHPPTDPPALRFSQTLIIDPVRSNDSKQMRHTLIYMAWLLWICFFPWQGRDQTNLGGGNLFLNSYHDNRNSLPPPPQGTCPQAPTCQLVGRVDRPPLSQVTVLISPTKVPTVPVGLMIWIPAHKALAQRLGTFTKASQQLAGRNYQVIVIWG